MLIFIFLHDIQKEVKFSYHKIYNTHDKKLDITSHQSKRNINDGFISVRMLSASRGRNSLISPSRFIDRKTLELNDKSLSVIMAEIVDLCLPLSSVCNHHKTVCMLYAESFSLSVHVPKHSDPTLNLIYSK